MDAIGTVGIDLAKHNFHVYAVDRARRLVVEKQLRRQQMMRWIAQLPPSVIAMEACSGLISGAENS